MLAQINQIDQQLGQKVEAYDAARYKLGQIERDQQVNRHDLGVARSNLKRAQKALAARLVSLYTADHQDTTLDVLLGAKSLDDLLSNLDTVNRVSDQDAQVLSEVISFRKLVRTQEHQLAAHAEQGRLVASLAAEKAHIESQLAQRRRLLSSIQGEIARLRAAEHTRQLALATEARARLAAGPPPSAGIGIAR